MKITSCSALLSFVHLSAQPWSLPSLLPVLPSTRLRGRSSRFDGYGDARRLLLLPSAAAWRKYCQL